MDKAQDVRDIRDEIHALSNIHIADGCHAACASEYDFDVLGIHSADVQQIPIYQQDNVLRGSDVLDEAVTLIDEQIDAAVLAINNLRFQIPADLPQIDI